MLLHGADAVVCDWVSNQLFGTSGEFDEKARAIGVVKDYKLIAGVVYNNYYPDISIEMSIASIDKSWCSRHNLEAFFKYPFIDLGVKRATTLCSANEEGVIMFNKRLGFVLEGKHREAWYAGGDALSWGMLKKECKWLGNK